MQLSQSLMKDLHYGQGYRYAHDEENAITDMECLPPALQGHLYYEPTSYGSEEKGQKTDAAAGNAATRKKEIKKQTFSYSV